MSDRNELTIVVVTWNSADLLPELLRALPAACTGIDGYELVVVDNGSTDGTAELVAASAPDATFVALGRNAGYAAGINEGVTAARSADAVLVLNPDVRPGPGSIRVLLDVARAPGVGIAVPRLRDERGTTLFSLRRDPSITRAFGEALLGGTRAGRYSGLGEVVTDPARYELPGPADWASGAAMLVTRECLDRVGPWDESFFLYSEETDFALRARDVGFSVHYAPSALATHLGGEAHASSRLWSILTLNRVRLYRRRHGPTQTAVFRAAVALNEAIRAAAGRPESRAALAALLIPSRRPAEIAGSP